MIRQVSIDGPTASGKTTLGVGLANSLDCQFIDTGLTYRLISLLFMTRELNSIDELPNHIDRIRYVPWLPAAREQLYVDDERVSEELFSSQVDNVLSDVSKVPEIRDAIKRFHKNMIGSQPVVVAGRDVSHQLLPAANPMIFLNAEFITRRERRRKQTILEPYRSVSVGAMTKLDYRTLSFVQSSPNGIVIETTSLAPSDVLKTAIRNVRLVEK